MFSRVIRMKSMPLILLAVVLAAAALAACGDDNNDNEGAAATATVATSTSTPAAATATQAATALTISIGDGSIGSYLVGPNDRALYVFMKDTPGKSNCSGQCLQTWPPLIAKDGQQVQAPSQATGKFGTIDTAAGKQVTYNDAPLYYFASDTSRTETKGQLVGNVWFVARPDTASTSFIGVRTSGDKTPYLVGPTGMTLYLFKNDTPNTSNCTGQCITNWPALTVPEGMDPTAVSAAGGTLGVFVRDDGKRQVTYNGLPVYYWANDHKPGDTTGDGVGNVWSLAKP